MPRAGSYVFIIHNFERGRERANLLAGILNAFGIPTEFGENLNGRKLSEEIQNASRPHASSSHC